MDESTTVHKAKSGKKSKLSKQKDAEEQNIAANTELELLFAGEESTVDRLKFSKTEFQKTLKSKNKKKRSRFVFFKSLHISLT